MEGTAQQCRGNSSVAETPLKSPVWECFLFLKGPAPETRGSILVKCLRAKPPGLPHPWFGLEHGWAQPPRHTVQPMAPASRTCTTSGPDTCFRPLSMRKAAEHLHWGTRGVTIESLRSGHPQSIPFLSHMLILKITTDCQNPLHRC